MNTIEFLPGTAINKIGTVNKLHFTDLFNSTYIIDDNQYTNDEIRERILDEKEILIKKLFSLLQKNKDFAFKFLTKMALKTQNIPLINSLNLKIEHLQTLLNKEYFNWSSYSNYSEAKTYLKSFLYSYFTQKID